MTDQKEINLRLLAGGLTDSIDRDKELLESIQADLDKLHKGEVVQSRRQLLLDLHGENYDPVDDETLSYLENLP